MKPESNEGLDEEGDDMGTSGIQEWREWISLDVHRQ